MGTDGVNELGHADRLSRKCFQIFGAPAYGMWHVRKAKKLQESLHGFDVQPIRLRERE